MSLLRNIAGGLRSLFRKEQADRELDEELRGFLEAATEEKMKQGMSRGEAARAVRLERGGLDATREMVRDAGWESVVENLWQDLRFGVRTLRKSPGFTATAILMLALGIGATTAIFSIVEGVLLRPLPFPDPDSLVVLGDFLRARITPPYATRVTAPDIRNYMRDTHSFSHLGGYRGAGFELSGTGDPTAVKATRMSGEVFAALRVAPLLGRTFTQEEDEQQQPVAVLSYGMWRNRFQGDATILGRKILLYRKPYTVIGVMPRNFEFPLMPGHLNQSELWVPLRLVPEEMMAGSAASWNLRMVGRLKPGVSAEQAQSDAERVAEETMRNYPAFMRSLRIHAVVTPLQRIRWNRHVRWYARCFLLW